MYTLWKLDSFPSDFHIINYMQTIPLRPVCGTKLFECRDRNHGFQITGLSHACDQKKFCINYT